MGTRTKRTLIEHKRGTHEYGCVKKDQGREIPAQIFIEAVKRAQIPCPVNQEGHPAVEFITDWWNLNAENGLQTAYGLALYVRYGNDWLAGDPEECWVSAEQCEKHRSPRAEGVLLNGRVIIAFIKRSTDSAHGFDAKCVDGSGGTSGGRWPGITGDGILTRYSHQALSIFPERFPDAWCELMHEHYHGSPEAPPVPT